MGGLSFWLTTLSLAVLVYAGAQWVNSAYVAPWRAAQRAQGAQGVKSKPRKLAFKKRSPRSQGSNDMNVGSEHQDARSQGSNVQSVQDSSAPPAAPGADVASTEGAFTLSARELVQLADALHRRAEGATVEEAVGGAFGVTKGGSEGWKRAKALFDAATVAPGAAPAGTYAAPAAPARRRRTHR